MWTAPSHTSPYKGQSEASLSPSTFLICFLGHTSGFPILVLVKASVEAGWSFQMIVFSSMKKKTKHLSSRKPVDRTDSICAACGPVTPQASSWLSHSWFRLLLANRNGRLLRVWLLWLLSFFGTGRIFCKWHLCRGISRWGAAAGFLQRTTKILTCHPLSHFWQKKKKSHCQQQSARR